MRLQILLASVPLATGLVARTAAPVRPPTSLKVRSATKPARAARAAAAHARDRDAAGERDPARRAADELDAQRAPVELHAVVGLDGLHGVLAAREDHLGGALAAAVLVKVQTRLLHRADLREEFLFCATIDRSFGREESIE